MIYIGTASLSTRHGSISILDRDGILISATLARHKDISQGFCSGSASTALGWIPLKFVQIFIGLWRRNALNKL